MTQISILLLGFILSLHCTKLAHGQDNQKTADATAWSWSAERANVVDSLLRFSKDYQVELIRPKNRVGDITIRVVDDGKELFAWEGHYRSVFTSSGTVLVYAAFLPSRTGCAVIAYDLKTQKQKERVPAKASRLQ